MRTILFGLGLVAFSLFAGAAVADSGQPLFNGKDLTGWHGMPHFDPYELQGMSDEARGEQLKKWQAETLEHWRVENGELINDGKGPYLTTDQDYGDIELRLEYRTVALADSGVYLRFNPQVQIWDTTEAGGKWKLGADKGSGGLWNNSPDAPGKDPLVHADKPFGEWNSLRILQIGERVTVYLNDRLVVDGARMENYWKKGFPLLKQGKIQLQTHGGEIRWRNLSLREIPVAEANSWLASRAAEGFASIFNGRDLTGWAGPLDEYTVEDGAMICTGKKHGTLHTEAEYDDFVMRFEYKLPPKGNNGLAIRYPGEGDTAYVGMCELQIADDNGIDNPKIDPRQYNGSAYGMVASHRGYLRPVGEWNFEEVTVIGPCIQVELNGTRILDTDLSQVTEFLGNSPHPGKDRTRGSFGFAGHDSPVAFRNISIKPVPKK